MHSSTMQVTSNRIDVTVQTLGNIPPVSELMADLDGQIPTGLPVGVRTTLGREIDAGGGRRLTFRDLQGVSRQAIHGLQGWIRPRVGGRAAGAPVTWRGST